jgi:hypothetical protein
MPRSTTPSYYEVFGGLNQESGSELGDTEARTLQNLYIRNRGQELQRRLGTSPINDELPGDGINADGLEWVRIDGANYLLAVVSGQVYDALADIGLFGAAPVSGGATRFTYANESNGCLINERFYLGNGVDQNIRWDGGTVAQVMPEQPANAATVAVSGAGVMEGTYQYYITFISADGIDSEPSAISLAVTAAVNKVQLSNIPVAATSGNSTGRRIWRNLTSGSTWYPITTLSDNTTTDYLDNAQDAIVDTTTELDLQTVRFPPCRYLINHQDRLVGIHCETSDGDLKTVFISKYQVPESCPLLAPLDETDDPTQGARIPTIDEATAVYSFGNVLLCWMRGSCYRLIGDNPNNWSFDKWIDNGCTAHRSVTSHRNLLFWLGPDGVYMAENWQTVTRISDPIREDLEAIPASGMARAHGFIWDDRYYILFPTKAFVFDLRYKQWGEHTGWLWRNSTVSRNTGAAKEKIYANLYNTTEVWELETGTDDDGTAIEAVWESKDKDFGHFGREKRVHRIIAAFKTGSGTATVELYRSGELLDTFSHDLSTVNRTGSEISVLDDHASEGARDEYFRIKVSTDTDAADFRLLRAGCHFSLCT